MPNPQENQSFDPSQSLKANCQRLEANKSFVPSTQKVCALFSEMKKAYKAQQMTQAAEKHGAMLKEMADSDEIPRNYTATHIQQGKDQAESLTWVRRNRFADLDGTIGYYTGYVVGYPVGYVVGTIISKAVENKLPEDESIKNAAKQGIAVSTAQVGATAGGKLGSNVGYGLGWCADRTLHAGLAMFSSSQKAGGILFSAAEKAEETLQMRHPAPK